MFTVNVRTNPGGPRQQAAPTQEKQKVRTPRLFGQRGCNKGKRGREIIAND